MFTYSENTQSNTSRHTWKICVSSCLKRNEVSSHCLRVQSKTNQSNSLISWKQVNVNLGVYSVYIIHTNIQFNESVSNTAGGECFHRDHRTKWLIIQHGPYKSWVTHILLTGWETGFWLISYRLLQVWKYIFSLFLGTILNFTEWHYRYKVNYGVDRRYAMNLHILQRLKRHLLMDITYVWDMEHFLL